MNNLAKNTEILQCTLTIETSDENLNTLIGEIARGNKLTWSMTRLTNGNRAHVIVSNDIGQIENMAWVIEERMNILKGRTLPLSKARALHVLDSGHDGNGFNSGKPTYEKLLNKDEIESVYQYWSTAASGNMSFNDVIRLCAK